MENIIGNSLLKLLITKKGASFFEAPLKQLILIKIIRQPLALPLSSRQILLP